MLYIETLGDKATETLEINCKKKLKRIKSLRDKREYELFDYVYSLIKDLQIFKVKSTAYCKKCNHEADNLREEGNDLFDNEAKWQEALQKFAQAIAHAEPGSESLSVAYFCRSRVFYANRLYNETVRDIERALTGNPPPSLRIMLALQRNAAEDFRLIHKSIELRASVPLPSHQNNHIQCASSAIQFAKDEKLGQYVVAERDISIGEVVAVEASYVNQVNVSQQYFHCHECLKMCYDLIACPNCTGVFYCGEECRLQAYAEYHKYECTLVQHGLKEQRLFVKLTLKGVLNYETYQKDLSTDDGSTFRSDRYKEVFSMKTLKERHSPKELFKAVLEPIAFYHMLTKHTSILEDLNFENKEIVLKEMLVKNFMIVEKNNVGVQKMDHTSHPNTVFPIMGSGIYPFYSYFRHSCFYNTMPIYYNSTVVIRALTNIKKGDSVTTSFGPSFDLPQQDTRAERAELLRDYYYECDCVACINDWVLVKDPRKGTPVPRPLQKTILTFINAGEYNPDTEKMLLDELLEFYNNLETTEVPTLNYMTLRNIIFDLMAFQGNIREY